jgi:hypothetical protein
MTTNFPAGFGDGFAPLFGFAGDPRNLLEFFIYAAAIALVTAIVVLWLVGLRHPKKRSRRRHRALRSSRRRNPTLAETGGLPPARGDQSSSPEQYQR